MSRKPAQEARALFAAASAEIDRLPEPHLRALAPVMVQAEAELARDLTRWLRTIPGGEARFTAQQYRVALVQLRAAMRRAAGKSDALFAILRDAKDDAGHMALGHLARQVEKFGALFPGSVRGLPFRPAAVLAKGDSLLIRRIRSSAQRYGEYVAQDIQRQLAVGMIRGETFAQMTTRIQKLAGHVAAAAPEEALTAGQRMAAAVVARHHSRAEMIVRSETIEAYNHVAGEAIKEAHADDPDYLKRWDATLDQRGCLRCRALHNVLREHDKEFPGGVQGPILHPRCRCCLTFWHRDWGAPPAIERDAPAAAGATKKETREVEKTPKAPAKIDRPAETPAAPPPVAPTKSLPEIPPVSTPPALPAGGSGGGGPPRSRGAAAVEREAQRPMATSLPANVTHSLPVEKIRAFEDRVEAILEKRVPFEEICHGFNSGPGTRMVVRELKATQGRTAIVFDVYDAKTGKRMTDEYGLVRDFHVSISDGRPRVHHSFFKLADEFQGRDTAKFINGNALLRYQKWGVAAADVEAAWVGRYAWASLGFKFDNAAEVMDCFRRYIARVGKSWSAARRAQVIADAEALVDRPWDFCRMDVGQLFPDEQNNPPMKGGFKLGKAFLLSRENNIWDGTLRVGAGEAGYEHALEVLKVWERE